MELLQVAALICAGIVAGWMNVMAGGGSMITVPALLLMDLTGPVANGTNRVAILAQNATAVTAFIRGGYREFRLSLTLALAAAPGAAVGAFVGSKLEGVWFNRVLAAVMIVVMLLMMANPKRSTDYSFRPLTSRQWTAGHLCMIGAGFWGGFIQIGVGFILMPILYRVMGMDLVRVNMHKVFIVLVYTAVALLIFASQVELAWLFGIWLALGNSIGGWLGARTTLVRGEKTIRIVLCAVLTAFIIKLLFF